MTKVQGNQAPNVGRTNLFEAAADNFMKVVEALAGSESVTSLADGFVDGLDKNAAKLEPAADRYVSLVESSAEKVKSLDALPEKIEQLVEKWL